MLPQHKTKEGVLNEKLALKKLLTYITSVLLEPGGIDHSESSRNNQSSSLEIANAPAWLINYRQLFGRITDFYRISFQVTTSIAFTFHEINGGSIKSPI